jgi:putative peptidoglycan lipid II flippase
MSDRGKKLAWAAVIVSAATGFSRLAGLLREVLMAGYYGASPELSAFASISVIPNLVNSLLADAAISAAFVPVFTRLIMEDARDQAFALASKLLTFVIVVVGAIVALMIVAAPLVIRVFFPKIAGDASLYDLSIEMMRLLMPTVLLLTSAGVIVGVLYSFERFTLPALGSIVWNLVTIVFMVAFAPHWGIWALVIGVIAGTVGQFLLVVAGTRGLGFSYRPSFAFRDRQLGRVLVLMVPVTLTLGILNFNALISQVFAWKVSEEGASHIYYAFRLFQLPQGMFAIAIGTVLFPTLSRLAATGDMDRFRETVSTGVRQIFFVSLPFICWFVFMPEAVVRVIYEHGRFTSTDTHDVAGALAFFTLGMLFANGAIMFNRAFQSLQKPWFPLYMGIANLALNALLASLLWRPLGVPGITLSTAIVSTVNFFGLMVLMRHQLGGVDGRVIATHLLRMLACGAVLTVISVGLWRGLHAFADRGFAQLLVVVLGSLAFGGLAYVGMARLLRVEELAVVSRLLRRRGRGTTDAEASA